jgi:death-on-curing protein
MARITYLTLEDFQFICLELKQFFKKNKEPHPVFENSYFDKLDSVIASPKQTFSKKDLYPHFFDKAACYFYFINKFHPFSNGNKRISIVATGVFLMYNGYEFIAHEDIMYAFAKTVTLSKKHQKEEFKEVVSFIKKNSRRQNLFDGAKFITDLIQLIQKNLALKR